MNISYQITKQVILQSMEETFLIFKLSKWGVFAIIGALFYFIPVDPTIEGTQIKDYGIYFIAFNVIILLMAQRIAAQNTKEEARMTWTLEKERILCHNEGEKFSYTLDQIGTVKIKSKGILIHIESIGKKWLHLGELSPEEQAQTLAYFKNLKT